MSSPGGMLDDWRQTLCGKVVVITGGAGWIARHIALTCHKHGALVVLADMNFDAIQCVREEVFGLEDTTDRILSVQLDVLDEETIKKAIEMILKKWSTIDVLVNTAAAFTLGYVEELSAEDWSHIMNVNVRGYALMVKHIAPVLKRQRRGAIVNISSVAGLVAHANFLPYSTSKGAIIQMTRNLALDLGPFNIRVNSICPGAIDSPVLYQTAAEGGLSKEDFDREHAGKCLKRLGHPQEIANTTLFLVSDLAGFITGANFVIDGGYAAV